LWVDFGLGSLQAYDTKPLRFSGGHFDLAAEPLRSAQGDLVSAAKPVEQMFSMNTQHFFQRPASPDSV